MNKNVSKTIAVSGIVLFLTASLSSCASGKQDVVVVPSDGPVYTHDHNDVPIAPGTKMAWTDEAYLSSEDGADYTAFQCPETSMGGFSFLAERGQERSPSAWRMSAQLGFAPGTHTLMSPMVTPDWLINGEGLQVKASGGTFSLGAACVENNGLTATRVFFQKVTITAGSGDWVFDGNK